GFYRKIYFRFFICYIYLFTLKKSFYKTFHRLWHMKSHLKIYLITHQPQPVALYPERAFYLRKTKQFKTFTIARFMQKTSIIFISFIYNFINGRTQRICIINRDYRGFAVS